MGRRTTQTILINAPTEQVWTALTDVIHWPEWTWTVLKIEMLTQTPFGVSARYRITQPKFWPAVYEVTTSYLHRGRGIEKMVQRKKIAMICYQHLQTMKTVLRPERTVFSPV